jgi:L-cysteate sulfo-lyase
VQSNHARQTAAAAAKLGLHCELIFEKRVDKASEPYLNSGNVLLDRLFGAQIREVQRGSDMDAALEAVADELRRKGRKPYVIPGGGSNPVGALGYVDCAQELVEQANRQGLVIDHIVHATGSAGTQAGLLVGLEANNCRIPVTGIGVNVDRRTQEQRVFALAERTAAFTGAAGIVARDDVVCNCDYVGPGYGMPTDAMNEALLLLARLEGLLFDPVYSGKALAGMLDLIARGHFAKTDTILFIHTGGVAGLFGYVDRIRFDSPPA